MSGGGDVFERLQTSAFRRRFRLRAQEQAYLAAKGQSEVLRHAAAFVARRLAPAHPANDGKQTPMRGHPVFIAQHATATCCRSCLAKWHGLEAGRALTEPEQTQVVAVIGRWLSCQALGVAEDAASARPKQTDLEALWAVPSRTGAATDPPSG